MSQTFVKIMSAQNLPDDHHNKEYNLIAIDGKCKIGFKQDPHPHIVIQGEEFTVDGNVYVMNAQGKTISTFTPKRLIKEVLDEPSEDPMPLGAKVGDVNFNLNAHVLIENGAIYLTELGTGNTYVSSKFEILVKELDYLKFILRQGKFALPLNSLMHPETKLLPNLHARIEKTSPVIRLIDATRLSYEHLFSLSSQDKEEISFLSEPDSRGTPYAVNISNLGMVGITEMEGRPAWVPALEDNHYDVVRKDNSLYLFSNKKIYKMADQANDILNVRPVDNYGFLITDIIPVTEIGLSIGGKIEYMGKELQEVAGTELQSLPRPTIDQVVQSGGTVFNSKGTRYIAYIDINRRQPTLQIFEHP